MNAVIVANICAGWAHGEPLIDSEGRDSGTKPVKAGFRRSPRFAPVVRVGGDLFRLVRTLVIASDDDDELVVEACGDGEDAGGGVALGDGRFGDVPGSAGVGGVEDAGAFSFGFRAARDEEEVLITLQEEAGVAGGEGAFAGEGIRAVFRGKGIPVLAVLGAEQGEFAVDGIAESEAARFGDAGDRKSTRLNSSHPSTSYAVLFLK